MNDSQPDHFQPWIPKNLSESNATVFEWSKPYSSKNKKSDSFQRKDELSFVQPFQSSWGGQALPLPTGTESTEEPIVFSMTQSEYDSHIQKLLNQQKETLQTQHQQEIQIYQNHLKNLEVALNQSLNFQSLRKNQIEMHFFEQFQPAMNALIDFFYAHPSHWNSSLIESILKQFDSLQLHSFFIQIHPEFLDFLKHILTDEVFSSYQWIPNETLAIGDLLLVEQPHHHHGFSMSVEQFKQSTIQWMKQYIENHKNQTQPSQESP